MVGREGLQQGEEAARPCCAARAPAGNSCLGAVLLCLLTHLLTVGRLKSTTANDLGCRLGMGWGHILTAPVMVQLALPPSPPAWPMPLFPI